MRPGEDYWPEECMYTQLPKVIHFKDTNDSLNLEHNYAITIS